MSGRAPRGLRWALAVLVAVLASLVAPGAEAHPPRTTAVFLDVGTSAIEAEMQLPLDQLGTALDRPLAAHPSSVVAQEGPALRSYVAAHLGATAPDGRPFTVDIRTMEVRSIDEADALVVRATLRAPEEGATRVFTLRDDVILERVVTHKIFVSVRRDFRNAVFAGSPEAVGVLRYQRPTLVVDRSQGSWWRGASSVFWLGTRHIAEGTDHLLFLLVLLLPAPLVASGGRWRERSPVTRSLRQIVSIVTAFTAGHSLTLLLAATGVVQVPSRPVEVLIAGSILVSAAHALRPLLPGREWLVAGGFGLIHGLAFASVLSEFGFDGKALALSVLSFNLGIEAMQLLVVALTMPWLLLLGRTRLYGPVRVAGASLAAVAAVAWGLERAWQVQNPVGAALDMALAHPVWPLASLIALAAGASLAERRTSTTRTEVIGAVASDVTV